jgi:hypothetical protein
MLDPHDVVIGKRCVEMLVKYKPVEVSSFLTFTKRNVRTGRGSESALNKTLLPL